ncbi:hypothetical protein D3C86_2064420 [compost metagenome]
MADERGNVVQLFVPDQCVQIAIKMVMVFKATVEFENDRLARVGEETFRCACERDGDIGLFVVNKPSVGVFDIFPHLSRRVAYQEHIDEQDMLS